MAPESEEERAKRSSAERLGAILFIVCGVAGTIASLRAVTRDGFWAFVKLDAADYGLPWWVTLTFSLFGIVADGWVLLLRRG